MREIDELITRAIEEKVFPSAAILIFNSNGIIYRNFYGTYSYKDGRKVTDKSLYDVASLTKPLVTSMCIAYLVEWGDIDFDQEVGYFLPDYKKPDKLGITIRDMLNHRAGLPAHRDYFKMIPEERWGTGIAKHTIIKEALNEEVVNRGRTLYSDIDFIILGHLVEMVSSTPFRDFVFENIFKYLKIENSDFCGNWEYMKKELMIPVTNELIGVDDENARAMGGIAGHSGLFSNVDDIYKILIDIYYSYHDRDEWIMFRADTVRSLLAKSNDFLSSMFRGGFDTPLLKGSQYGDNHSDNTIGHLGFTGTSFILDLESGEGVILLTNRVCPDRNNLKIKDFRREIHNKIFSLLRKEES